MAKTITFERVSTPTMYVGLGKGQYHDRVARLETFISYSSEWRGEPVAVTMSCDRYRYGDSEKLSDWRVYASDARYGTYRTKDNPDGVRGNPVTDTARRRLSDAIEVDALAWLESDEARAAYRQGVYDACVREVKDTRAYDYNGGRGFELLERLRGEMGSEHAAKFEKLATAWAAWVHAVENA